MEKLPLVIESFDAQTARNVFQGEKIFYYT
jgi:hypothetical protein